MATICVSKELLREHIVHRIHHAQDEAYRRGKQEGWQEGQRSGATEILVTVLKLRLGTLPSRLESEVRSLSFEQSQNMAIALPQIKTIQDLEAWLQRG